MTESPIPVSRRSLPRNAGLPGPGAHWPSRAFAAAPEAQWPAVIAMPSKYVGTGKDEGLFGWSGAAGTIGFAQMKLGLRTGLYVQYMPQSRYPILKEFPKAVGADLTTKGKAPA